MNPEHEEIQQPSSSAVAEAAEPRKMSRREALALVGKHAVYTAPAVLAVLAATKSGDASATVDCGGSGQPPCLS